MFPCNSNLFLPPKFGKRLCFYTCLSVILFTGGVCIWGVCIQRGLHGGRGVLHLGDIHPGGSASREVCIQGVGQTPPPHFVLWETVNEWAVRILLECILVCIRFLVPTFSNVNSMSAHTCQKGPELKRIKET